MSLSLFFLVKVTKSVKSQGLGKYVPLSHVAGDMHVLGREAFGAAIFGDWESNCQPFHSHAHAQSTELHQPGKN